MTGILKYNNMENDAKAHNGSQEASKNVGDGMTSLTLKVTLGQTLHPCFDVDNAPSQDDDESSSKSSSSSFSLAETKVWQKTKER